MKRRDFLKAVSIASGASVLDPLSILAGTTSSQYFGVHPFIEAHPEAVFIKRTSVSVKTDSAAKQQAGYDLASEIFTLQDTSGIPLSAIIAIKPNLTATSGTANTDAGMGIITDENFMEGLINGMKHVGLQSANMVIREGNMLADGYGPQEYLVNGYVEMGQRTGVNVVDLPSGRKLYQVASDALAANEIVWKDCPNGVIFKRIGYLAPFNQSGSWLLNVSKFKAHGMGMTLCAKNMQGMCIPPYVRFCNTISDILAYPAAAQADFQPDLQNRITQLYQQHVTSIPRWDRPGVDFTGGFGQELWAQRTCDSHTVSSPGLSIIEGIYGRNGTGFVAGPGPNGEGQDFMSNVVIFGKNPFLTDVIGFWLSGHEPGNIGLFHIAKQRGLLSTFNPSEIPVYLWDAAQPALTKLSSFQRTPLVTDYLCRDYNGQTEDQYHLVNERYDYTPVIGASGKEKPTLAVLGKVRAKAGPGSIAIEYVLPREEYTVVELYSAQGQRLRILAQGRMQKGAHSAALDYQGLPAGEYYCRLKTPDFSAAKAITVFR
jgi:uncharacterized protein (DUF362 family)